MNDQSENLAPLEQCFVEHCESHGVLAAAEVETMLRLWTDAGTNDTFLKYFVRQGVVANTAALTLRMIDRGTLDGSCIVRCFTSRGLDTLKRELAYWQRSQPSKKVAPKGNPAPQTAVSQPSAVESQETLGSGAAAKATKEVPFPDIGTSLGQYMLARKLGDGASCVVFEAIDTKKRKSVAVKIFSPRMNLMGGDTKQQFLEEAQLLSWLDHPNIVRVIDYQDGRFPAIVMELVSGLSLEDLIRQSGHIAVPQAVQIIYKATQALAHAHSYNVIHRDVKPANILIAKDGTVKLADLGISRFQNELVRTDERSAPRQLVGTAYYVAPEQAMDPDSADLRADIYSMGATFYHALTGERPFEGTSVNAVIAKHIHAKPRPLQTLCPQAPKKLCVLVHRMLEKDPNKRYPDARSVAEEMREMLENLDDSGGTIYSPEETQIIRKFQEELHDTGGSLTVQIKRSLVELAKAKRRKEAEGR